MKITSTSNEDSYDVLYRAVPDQRVLGQKLKKDFGKVKKAIEVLKSSEVKEFTKNGKINIDGYELGPEDLQVSSLLFFGRKKGR